MEAEKDEDLADFIKAYTPMDWEAIKKDLPALPTEKLIEIMLELKLYVNKPIALEIARRNDAVFWMRKLLMEDEQYWDTEGPGEAWAPYHAIHILALVKGREALELLLDAMRYNSDELGDWLSESCTSLLVAFGEDAIESLKEFTEDDSLDIYARLAATAAIAVLARKFPVHKEDVKAHLIKLLNATGDTTFASFVSGDLASLRDPSVMSEISRAYKAGKIERSIIAEKDIDLIIKGLDDDFERNTQDPLKHFSRESIEYLHSIHYPERKEVKIEKKNFDSGEKDELKMMAGKDEDLADLIGSETSLKWDEIKAKMSELSTKELVELMVELGLYVNKSIALEIAKRNDAVFWLRKLLQEGQRWYSSDTGFGWSPIHAIHILAVIKSEEALELLLDVLRFRGEDLGDYLTEDVSGLLVAFGDSGVERLKEFSCDETLEPFVRGAAISALKVLARKFPAFESDVKSHMLMLLNTTKDTTFAALVADDLAFFHDLAVLPEIHRAFEEGRADDSFIKEDEIEAVIRGEYADMDEEEFKRYTEDPIRHFSRASIERLHRIHYSRHDEDVTEFKEGEDYDEYEDDFMEPEPPKPKKKKIGRNEPCPCGSGIKYKKCCLGKEEK